jgi:hypothetical protein
LLLGGVGRWTLAGVLARRAAASSLLRLDMVAVRLAWFGDGVAT